MRNSAVAARIDNETSARPFLKWAGGKTQLLDAILARFPKHFNRYHEPFLGGGAVFFALQPQRAVLSDINADLIQTYMAVRDNVSQVIRSLRRHRVDAQHFYRVRALNTRRLSVAAQAARTIYLNRTCFNGLYRVNRKGQFNVPFGRYTNPTVCNEDNLHAVAEALDGVNLLTQSVYTMGARVRRNDLVYFDPPYDPVSPTASFTAYARQAFGREEQARLADQFRRFASRGVHVVLSNSDTPFIRSLYKGFRIERVFARRAINSRANGRGAVGEVIISAE